MGMDGLLGVAGMMKLLVMTGIIPENSLRLASVRWSRSVKSMVFRCFQGAFWFASPTNGSAVAQQSRPRQTPSGTTARRTSLSVLGQVLPLLVAQRFWWPRVPYSCWLPEALGTATIHAFMIWVVQAEWKIYQLPHFDSDRMGINWGVSLCFFSRCFWCILLCFVRVCGCLDFGYSFHIRIAAQLAFWDILSLWSAQIIPTVSNHSIW